MPVKKVIKKNVLTPTVLIAGGAGFIGSHLAEALLLKDARVIVLDNFKTGKDFWIGHLLSNPKFALFDVDINTALPQEIETVDYIFHLAGVEEYLYSDNEINLDALLTNAVGTKALLDLADRSSAKFMLASSIYVYQGMMSQINLSEYFGRTNFDEKKYSLTEAKRYAEALVWEYFRKNETDVRIVRLPEIYGPKMDLEASGNLGRLLTEMVDDKDLTIFGEGYEKEHYLYISDAIAGIIKALFNDKTKGKIYSLVGPEPYSVLETGFLLKSLAKREIKVNFKPKVKMIEPRTVYPDTSNLRELKWDIKTSFKEGITRTLAWYGYETNEYSFKPAKLIGEKQKEKAQSGDNVLSSLAEGIGLAGNSKSGVEKKAGQEIFFGNEVPVPLRFQLLFQRKTRPDQTPSLPWWI
jgi:UDP-glucuronate decarboxylase